MKETLEQRVKEILTHSKEFEETVEALAYNGFHCLLVFSDKFGTPSSEERKV